MLTITIDDIKLDLRYLRDVVEHDRGDPKYITDRRTDFNVLITELKKKREMYRNGEKEDGTVDESLIDPAQRLLCGLLIDELMRLRKMYEDNAGYEHIPRSQR